MTIPFSDYYSICYFKDLFKHLNDKNDSVFIVHFENSWWLSRLHDDIPITLGYTISPNFIKELKKLNKIIPELSDEEYRIQRALGTVNGRYYKIV